jgi:hypothetical protein
MENGGELGQIQFLGNLLIIRQSRQNHERIDALFEQIRRQQDPAQLLTIRALWIYLDAEQLNQVQEFSGQSKSPMLTVPPELLANESLIYCRAQTCGFSGRAIELTSGRAQTYVADVTPIVGTQALGFDPLPAQATSGVRLAVRPQTVSNGQIVISMDTQVSEVSSITTSAGGGPMRASSTRPSGDPSLGDGAIDRVNEMKHTLRTTLRLPVGQDVLIGGMTLDPAAHPEQQGQRRQLFLVVRVTPVE